MNTICGESGTDGRKVELMTRSRTKEKSQIGATACVSRLFIPTTWRFNEKPTKKTPSPPFFCGVWLSISCQRRLTPQFKVAVYRLRGLFFAVIVFRVYSSNLLRMALGWISNSFEIVWNKKLLEQLCAKISARNQDAFPNSLGNEINGKVHIIAKRAKYRQLLARYGLCSIRERKKSLHFE